MIIRKNSKEFKAIKSIIEDYAEDKQRKKHIQVFSVPSGKKLNDRTSLSNADKGMADLYYDYIYDQILANLNDEDHTLQQSDENERLYYFHSSTNKEWDETPFELSAALQKNLLNYQPRKRPVKKKQESEKKKSQKQRGAVRRLQDEKPDKIKNVKKRPEPEHKEFPLQSEKSFIKRHLSEDKRKEVQPEFKLKHHLHFNYPDKIVFPELKLKKRDILQYYYDLKDYILPYLKDRPQFFRWHRGNIKESQYNKSIESLTTEWKGSIPSWVRTTKMHAVTYQEDRHYIICHDIDHLLFLVEIGCVEISPWHSRLKSIDKPDYLIIDLNPVDLEFSHVVEVAQASKQVLDTLKIPSLVKTSGNIGLHIYIPLDTKSDYETGRFLCEALCKLIHISIPELTSLQHLKEKRQKKVYLDSMQNSLAKTIAAPYCIRPNEFAGVATPLEWEELNDRLDIKDLNFYTVKDRLKREGDPFEQLYTRKINAENTLAKLKELYGFLL